MYGVGHFERESVTVLPDAPAWRIADEMDRCGVGCVVVVDDSDAPVGIVTDRDLVRRVVVQGRDAEKATAADVMTPNPVTASPHDTLDDLLDQMRAKRIRRVPIVEDGRLSGIVSLDDVVHEASSQLWNLSDAVSVELRETRRTAAQRRRRELREEAIDEIRDQLASLRDRARDELAAEIEALARRLRR